MRGWIEWFAGLFGRNWKPIVGTLFVLSLPILIPAAIILVQANHRPARTMTDPSFVRAADSLCTKKVRPLAEKQRSSSDEAKYNDTPKANAKRIDDVADKLEAAVAQLRALPHLPANTSQLNAWFAQYDRYIAAGRRYAEALRTTNEAVYSKVDDESVAPLKAISHFARANYLDSCIP